MKVHDLKPAAGSDPQAASASVAASAARAARPPAAAPRARGPATPSPAGFEGGQMPLHMRVPEAKGFKNPFRVEYQALNLDVLEASRPRRRSPRDPPRARPDPQGRPVKVLGRGEITRAVQVEAHAFSKSAEAAITAAGGTVEVLPLPCGDRPPAGQGQPAHQPLAPRPPDPADRSSTGASPVLSSLQNIFKVPDLRNKVLFTLLMIVLYRFGAHMPVPGIDVERAQDAAAAQAEPGRRARLPAPLLRRRAHPVRHLRPRDHAVHHGVDHHADPRRGDPQARGVAGAGRGRPAQDHPVDPLPHHRHRRRCSRPA